MDPPMQQDSWPKPLELELFDILRALATEHQ